MFTGKTQFRWRYKTINDKKTRKAGAKRSRNVVHHLGQTFCLRTVDVQQMLNLVIAAFPTLRAKDVDQQSMG